MSLSASTRTYLVSSTTQEATATIAEVTLKIPLEAADGSAVTKITGQATTANGSVAYVLKSSRSQYSKKLKEAVAFVPRRSHFDIENERSSTNEFRGFFTLVLDFALHLYYARTLALSDAVLVLSTGICVPFAKAVSKGWIRYYWTGVVLQHTLQTFILFAAIKWTFNRQWPWVQSGFLTLHTFVMLMKMHSYMATNGYLKHVSQQSTELLTQLRDATSRAGGWEKAISDATKRREAFEHQIDSNSTETSTSSIVTPELSDGVSSSYVQVHNPAVLRNRLTQVAEPAHIPDDKPKDLTPRALVDHPDPEISALATEYLELESELVSSGPERVRWPENITLKNFAVYQLIPTLVYELEFPRTNKIRPLTLLDLALPFMLAYLLLFYIIFECICNGFAELSYFADRGFYEDWWNSTSWDEFSRKWNKPVHNFLLRHVYASTISSYQFSRSRAMFVTFLLSAAAHELVMAVVTKKIRMYLFTMQLIQIPLIAVGRTPAIKRNKSLGNVVFWLGLYAGFPLLCVAYVLY
ncbi:MBOAT, membrane-bound O-acyltransferase family-domain-containing protein [Lactarius hengduanensis]|nr:MBOAT, membrane-bound O-acyltransferase family-domain-containing protein [Lactarius hengduanensis]